jgi:hypothetical protein
MKMLKLSLVLLALLALIPCTPSMAQTAPANTADFLATLSVPANAPANAPANVPAAQTLPAPTFLATSCTSSSQCPTGQLCCYPCGIDGCTNVCTTPVRGHCPFYP